MQAPAGSGSEGGAQEIARLADALKVVASPTRLRLLQALRVPKKAAELRIPAEEDRGGLHPERLLSRTTLIEHLDVLEQAGLVDRLPEDAGFVISQQDVFALVDSLGRLASIRPVVQVDVEVTRPSAQRTPGALPAPPRLVLVGGPAEGQGFALQGKGPWLVGRGAGAEVRLDYDPHVSRLQLRVQRATQGFVVEALRESTNPARLDFESLRPGHPVALRPGAVLAVGASRLVFQS